MKRQYYCQHCETWYQVGHEDESTAHARAAHQRNQCGVAGHPDLPELDALAAELERLYLTD